MRKPRRVVLEFFRARQAEGKTPNQLRAELLSAMLAVYSDYRMTWSGKWYRDIVCPTCGLDIGDGQLRCRVKGHTQKPVLRREYSVRE